MNLAWIATINQWSDIWAAGLWRACWQGGAAILLVWGACRVVPQMPPRVRCWLWRLAYAKLLLALLWTAPVELPLLRAPHTAVSVSAPLQQPVLSPTSHRQQQVQVHGAKRQTSVVIAPTTLTPLSALAILWLLGVIVVGAEVVREWRSARLRSRSEAPDTVADAELTAEFAGLCRRCGIRRPIALLASPSSDRPHIRGILRPAIVLPTALLAESDRPGLMAVMAHEIAHVQRQDLLWNWLPAVVHALFFFCPVVWLANREWQIAQEIACDELAVLNTRIDAADYGEMLVRMVAPTRRSLRPGIATLGIIETPQTLKRRLIAMKFLHPISRRKLIQASGACLLLGIFGLVPWQVVAQETKPNKILFVSNRAEAQRFRIFAMDPDGSHVVQLTRTPLPEFEVVSNPDGKLGLRPSTPHRNAMELDPVWSSDGKRIAFTLAVSEKPEQESRVKMNIYVMNADGSDCKQVTYFDYGLEAVSPAWSPDGKRIAFTLRSHEKGAPAGITTTICATDLKGFWTVAQGMWPSWTLDGKAILYSAYADRKGIMSDLFRRNAYGSGEQQKLVEGVLQGVLSPDGKRLAYVSLTLDPGGDPIRNLVVSNADGSEPKQLTQLREAGPVGLHWSSNGKHIYFTRPASPGAAGAANYRIYGIEADGSHLQALTKGDAPDYLGAAPNPFLTDAWMKRIAAMK